MRYTDSWTKPYFSICSVSSLQKRSLATAGPPKGSSEEMGCPSAPRLGGITGTELWQFL